MGGFEVGDDRVVVLFAQLLDDPGVALATLVPGRPEVDVELGEAGSGDVDARPPARRGGSSAALVGLPDEPDVVAGECGIADAEVRRGQRLSQRCEHHVIDLEVGCSAIAEEHHRVAVDLPDLLRDRAVEDGCSTLALQPP